MTCAIGLEAAGAAWLACDAFVGDDNWRETTTEPKWFRLGARLVVAYAGSLRSAQAAMTTGALRGQRRRESDVAYLSTVVVEAIRQQHRAFEAVGKDHDFAYIIAHAGKVFGVLEDYGVYRPACGFLAIGTGEQVAVGAVAALPELPPEKRLRRALRIATSHCGHVSEPFTVLRVG